jgi:hypothetical protein
MPRDTRPRSSPSPIVRIRTDFDISVERPWHYAMRDALEIRMRDLRKELVIVMSCIIRTSCACLVALVLVALVACWLLV